MIIQHNTPKGYTETETNHRAGVFVTEVRHYDRDGTLIATDITTETNEDEDHYHIVNR